MARKTGITKETVKHMLLDAGAVYINYGEENERLYGATREGSEFQVEQDVREVEIDGLRGPIKGGRRVVEEHARLTVNLLEMTAENVATAIPGAYTEESDGKKSVLRSLDISDLEYLKNVALVADYSGSSEPVVIIIENALADGDFNLEAEDREEATVEVQFTAHFDSENLDKSPWRVEFPDTNSNDNGDEGED